MDKDSDMKTLKKLFTILTIPAIAGGVLPITLLITSCSKPSGPLPPVIIHGFGQITLNDGRKIEVPRREEFDQLCSSTSAASPLIINGTTFVKNTLTGFAYGKDFVLTSINDYFLVNCTSFNQSFTIPSSVNSIGNSFLRYCSSFNHPLTIPSTVESIGNYFLASCTSLDNHIYCPGNATKPSG